MGFRSGLLLAALLAAALPPSSLQAQDAMPFYNDKQIRIILSAGVAGGYMEYARTLAEHMGKHVAGHPTAAFVPGRKSQLLRQPFV